MLWKCYTQYASKFGKLSSGYRSGKGQFSIQSQGKVKVVQWCLTVCDPMDYSLSGSSVLESSRILVELPFPLQATFPTQGSNPDLLHCRQILDHLCNREIPILKKGNAKECSDYHTILHISHASKVMVKILQARLLDVQARFRKDRGTRDQIANIHWIKEKQDNSRKTSPPASLPLTVWIATNWTIFKEMGIPNHLSYLLRNLYAGQEAAIKTRHGTMDWFKFGKGVWQNFVLSPCLFNLHAEFSSVHKSCEMIGWMNHKLKLFARRLPGEISTTSYVLMTQL